MPSLWQLFVALAARRPSALEAYLLIASCVVLLVLHAWWAAVLLPLSAILFEWLLSDRSAQLVRRWRAVRTRRTMLNGAAHREARRAALHDEIVDSVAQAERAWRIYMNDAVVGRTHSVIHDRPAPNIQPLQRLEGIRARAAALNIDLTDDDASPAEPAAARLQVPPADRFEPDTLSPTMMNLTAESLAHAKAEGSLRAARRHELATRHAADFAPAILFADRAALASRE